MPGLFPDVPADDPIAYAFWIGAYDTPPSGALPRITPLLGPRVSLAMRAHSEIEGVLLRRVPAGGRHPHWELCLACQLHSSWPRRAALALAGADARVTILELPPGTPAIEVLRAPPRPVPSLACSHPVIRWRPPRCTRQCWPGPETLLVYTDEDQADPAGCDGATVQAGL